MTILESLPTRPLPASVVEQLERSERVHYAGCIVSVPPHDGDNDENTENVCGDIVLSTAAASRFVTLREDRGWIVYTEIEHADEDDPRTVGERLRRLAADDFLSELKRHGFDVERVTTRRETEAPER